MTASKNPTMMPKANTITENEVSRKPELTISTSLEKILNAHTDKSGNDSAKDSAAEETEYICSMLEVTPTQALLLAAIAENCIGGTATPDCLAKKLGCSNLHFLTLRNDIDVLSQKRYVISTMSGFKGLRYMIPDNVLKSFQLNRKPEEQDIKGLTKSALLRQFNRVYRNLWNSVIDYDAAFSEIKVIMESNPLNDFVRTYEALELDKYDQWEQMLFLFMLLRNYRFGETEFGWEHYGAMYRDSEDEDFVSFDLENQSSKLQMNGFVEFVCNDGIADNTHISIVKKYSDMFLGDLPKLSLKAGNSRNIIAGNLIKPKEMFYSESVSRQIESLTDLLQKENFDKVVARLKEKNFRTGFNSIFTGPAGTGKTESVYQIARNTGRDIFFVDLSSIKSKWVGDSEKNIKQIFSDYRELVKTSELCPILLFNEADAIFGLRKKGADNAVDKMENAIQNIILQEMESLEGILIATTNLSCNFDPAFERRFIYKVQFDKPDVEAKTKLWSSMVEGLDPESAETLARRYDFSGGQIENISRKMTVDYILSGKVPEIESIIEFCNQETFSDSPDASRRKIGF